MLYREDPRSRSRSPLVTREGLTETIHTLLVHPLGLGVPFSPRSLE